jgi:outer membrane protein assembly factor BamE (lipoprotein component of BamABCDE complex)
MIRPAKLAVVALTGLAACAPRLETHGYTPVLEALERVEAGVDTRGSVQRKIGRPSSTGVFGGSGWYYVSTQVEHYLYHEPTVVDRKVVAVTFDENDVVASVDVYGLEDGRVIDLETRTTPTYGQQLTIVEQIFSNIGTFAGSEVFED